MFFSPSCSCLLIKHTSQFFQRVLLHAALSSAIVSPAPIDFAVVESLGAEKQKLGEYDQLKFVPFNPISRKSTAIIRRKADGKIFKVCKGAPEVVRVLFVCFPFQQTSIFLSPSLINRYWSL